MATKQKAQHLIKPGINNKAEEFIRAGEEKAAPNKVEKPSDAEAMTCRLVVQLTKAQKKALKLAALTQDKTTSDLIRECINRFIENPAWRP